MATAHIESKMEDIAPIVLTSGDPKRCEYIAKTYFNKSRQWLYQRINGNIVNGKQASFTKEEIDILNHALNDIGNRLINTRIV